MGAERAEPLSPDPSTPLHSPLIRLYFQIWDTHTSGIAWEGVEELSAAYDTFGENAVTSHSMVQEAARELIAKLP